MFVGEYEHSLDPKGRVVLPADYRALVVDRGYVMELDGCLGLWSKEGFAEVTDRLKERRHSDDLSMNAFRKLMRRAKEVRLDSAGRITIPRKMLDSKGFDSQVVLTGALDRVEIWPSEQFGLDEDTEESKAEMEAAVASFL